MPLDFSDRKTVLELIEIANSDLLSRLGLQKPYLSVNAASKIFGASRVNSWIKEKLISFVQDGSATSPKLLKRTELEVLARCANRTNYKTVKERRSLRE